MNYCLEINSLQNKINTMSLHGLFTKMPFFVSKIDH